MAKGETYEEFVAKFDKEKEKTTDDCYTPKSVYNAVVNYCIEEYKIDKDKIVRPFYPGGDYEKEDYTDCVVVDNPPFSMLSKIISFYIENNIKFFLFAPTLTCMHTCSKHSKEFCRIFVTKSIIYENNANVNTAFVTNLDNEYVVKASNKLSNMLLEAQPQYKRKKTKTEKPSNWFSGADIQTKLRAGEAINIKKQEAEFIRKIEGKSIFGGAVIKNEVL